MKTPIAVALALFVLWSCNSPTKEAPPKTEEETPSVPIAKKPYEIGDEKLINITKDGMTKLSTGDVEGFLNLFSEDAVYRWNNGDSIAGKPALVKYWTDRRKNVITKLQFSEEVWLPMTVNDMPHVRPGKYVLFWYKTDATYKTGKSMKQYMHTIYHFNNDDKVDEVIHYLDRGMVKAASGK